MEYVFHEKQEGSLCAQHCLNNLLQGAYFNPVDLGNIGRQLDEAERSRMAEGGVDSTEYNQFLARPSSNVDDSGFFSVQVIEEALKGFSVRLVRFDSPDATQARANPASCTAFICNLMEHWLTIRKIGRQWFNLNSLLTGPHLLTGTYLSMYLEQLRVEGYSIFLVEGDLPQCAAHDVLLRQPAVQLVAPPLISTGDDDDDDDDDRKADLQRATSSRQAESDELEQALRLSQQQAEDDELQKVLLASRAAAGSVGVESGAGYGGGSGGVDDEMLRHAIQASLGAGPAAATPLPAATAAASSAEALSSAEVRRRRLAFFDKSAQQQGGGGASAEQPAGSISRSGAQPRMSAAADSPATACSASGDPAAVNLDVMSEEEQLRYALSMSEQQ